MNYAQLTKLMVAFWGAALIIVLTATEQSWITHYLVKLEGGSIRHWQDSLHQAATVCGILFIASAIPLFARIEDGAPAKGKTAKKIIIWSALTPTILGALALFVFMASDGLWMKVR
jgi:hypothetical protein